MSNLENQSGGFIDRFVDKVKDFGHKHGRRILATGAVGTIMFTAGCQQIEGQETTTTDAISSSPSTKGESLTTDVYDETTNTITLPTTRQNNTTTAENSTTNKITEENTTFPSTSNSTTERDVTRPTTTHPRTTRPSTTRPSTTRPTTEKPTTTRPETTTKKPDQLEGVAPERLEFTKDMLNLYEKSSADRSSTFNKIKNFVTKDQIINYGKTGSGLSVIEYGNGTPAFALINCNAGVTNAVNTMVSEMSNYDSNYLRAITNNGVVALMDNGMSGGNFNFNKEGLISWFRDSDDEIGSAQLKRPVLTESFGIKMLNLGGDYAKYIGFMKEQLASDCWWNLYKKNGDNFCNDMSQSTYMITKIMYNPIYAPVDFRDKEIQDLLKSVRNNNKAASFGGSWPQISANLSSRPDWTA